MDWLIEPGLVKQGAEIGRGSFGVVRLAQWRHATIAVKILFKDAETEDKELFEKEVKIMATLHHPNIVQFFGYTRLPELALVIEWFPEGSLEDFVATKKATTPAKLVGFCVDMALAIEYLHARQPSIVIHRDLKPANFLLTGSHRVKLGDFGIARTETTALLMDGTTNCGTVRFMAPEVAATDAQGGGQKTKKKQYSTKADVYSLSLVYYFVWERIAPTVVQANRKQTPAHHLDALVHGRRPDFHRTPRLMRDLVQTMWATDPDDRPDAPSVLDYLYRLRCRGFFASASGSLVMAKKSKKRSACCYHDVDASKVPILNRRHTYQ